MREALQAVLGADVSEPVLLAGGASKEAWAVDAGGEPLLVRRAAVGVIHRHTLSLADEFAVLEAAYDAGVRVPRPLRYIPDLAGREAFVMERLEGETIGRRIVRKDRSARPREGGRRGAAANRLAVVPRELPVTRGAAAKHPAESVVSTDEPDGDRV